MKDIINSAINQALKDIYKLENVDFQIEYPPNNDLGDYSCNVAMVIRTSHNLSPQKNPMEIGQEITKHLSTETFKRAFSQVKIVKPGFINFFLSKKILLKNLEKILKQKEKFGSSKIGKNKTIILDYSSPNVAKNMHAGHLRSTIIGDALKRIFKFLDYKVIGDNHVGDWGTQYGILLLEYKSKYGDKIKKGLKIDELEKMYVEYMQKEKQDAKIRIKAKAELKKLQAGDKTNLKLWRYFYKISQNEFDKIYQKLKIEPFDIWHGESFYNKMLPQIVKSALKKKVAQKSQGAIIINLKK